MSTNSLQHDQLKKKQGRWEQIQASSFQEQPEVRTQMHIALPSALPAGQGASKD